MVSPLFIGGDTVIGTAYFISDSSHTAHPLLGTKDSWMDTVESKCEAELSDQGE